MIKIFFPLFFFAFLFSCSVALNNNNDFRTGIEGYVLSSDNTPEGDVYVSLYRSLSSGLIGPSDFMVKTDENGYFFFDVPEGRYYLVARKRLKGGDSGPLREGDRAVIYKKNPIEVKPNKITKVKLTLPIVTSIHQKKIPLGDKDISVKIKGDTNKNLKLLIYEGEDIKRSPSYILNVSEKEISVKLFTGKKYIFVLREGLKERIGENEFFKIYGPFLSDNIESVEFELK